MPRSFLSYPRNGSGAPPSASQAPSADKWKPLGLNLVGGKFSVMKYPFMGVKWRSPFPEAHTHLGAEALPAGAALPFPPAARDPRRPAYLDSVLPTFSGQVTDRTYTAGTVVYRVVGDEAAPVSKHWTTMRYRDEATLRRELALLCEWNGDKSLQVLELRAPLDGHAGRAASQYINGPNSGYILRGGGEQIVFDPRRLESLLDDGLASVKLEPL